MNPSLFRQSLPYAFILYTGLSLGAVPITVTFDNGTTSFASNGSGTANYVVNVKGIAPANVPLAFNSNPNSSNGLAASQVTTGASGCLNVSTICSSPTFLLKANQSCCLQYALTSNNQGNYTIQPSVSSTPVETYRAQALSPSSITVSGVANTTPLTATPSTLALSVDCTTVTAGCTNINAALTGNARLITIQNTSTMDTTTPLTVTSASLPSGTSITTDNCTGISLAPQRTCTITVKPGSEASLGAGNHACTSGIKPNPATITVNASSAPSPISSTVYVLSYGCQYQGGFLYSVDDTINNGQTGTCLSQPCTGSIGGKIAALTDQAPAYPNGIVWSSNGGTGGGSGGLDSFDVSYDTLPGIDQISTSSAGSPTYSAFTTFFSNTYTNSNPFTSASFSICNGNSDGSCNTANILTFYNRFITNNTIGRGTSPKFTASNGPTPLSYYAAGRCSNYTIDSAGNSPCLTGACYTNWYLPAICEMGPDSGNGICSTTHVEQNMVNNLSFLLKNTVPCTTPSGCLAGSYWSSTEYSSIPLYFAWYEGFGSGGASHQNYSSNNFLLGVRCSRALTF